MKNNRTGTLEKHLEPGSVYRNTVRKYGRDTGSNAEVNGLCVRSLRTGAKVNLRTARNTWATGSIYGNVQFAFHWRNQIRRRHCYWVEPMTAYSPKAYRILLTERDLSQSNRERICR